MSTRFDFSGRVVLVTGAARGIGLNVARQFCESGAFVSIIDIDRETGERAAETLRRSGGRAVFSHGDLAAAGEPARVVQDLAAAQGKIDVLVNNAASGPRTTLFEETEASWAATMAVTLRATFFTSQEAIRHMRQQAGGGCIVNIGSVLGTVATLTESPSYHVAKAGVQQMTRYLATAAGEFGVRVNCIAPGFIVKDEHLQRFNEASNESYRETAKRHHPLRGVGTSDDVAAAVLFLCSPEAKYITGECLTLDGGVTKQEHFALIRQLGAAPADGSVKK